jgi:hypothetical protein
MEFNKLRRTKNQASLVRNAMVHQIAEDEIRDMALNIVPFGTQGFEGRSEKIFNSGKKTYSEKIGKQSFEGSFPQAVKKLASHCAQTYLRDITKAEVKEIGLCIAWIEGEFTFVVGFVG